MLGTVLSTLNRPSHSIPSNTIIIPNLQEGTGETEIPSGISQVETVYAFSCAAAVNYHKLGGLKHRHLFSRNSGDQEPQIRGLAGPHFI